jgi:DNA polymerase-3 subunit epsilon
MFTQLSLRLRIFLFFCLIALGGSAVIWGALYAGYSRAMSADLANGFILSAIISTLGLLALTVGVWLLFDENVAKPIERLSAQLRVRAHAGVDTQLDAQAARYLGDLAPAATAVSQALNETTLGTVEKVAMETQRLELEKARLTALLTEIPVAMILVSPEDQIVLYDGQAAEVLAQQGVPRLNAALGDYFDAASLSAARQKLVKTGQEVTLSALGQDGLQSYDMRMKPMQGGGYMLVIDSTQAQISAEAARPLTYDFDLLDRKAHGDIDATPLRDLSYTVFDTETTGLLPHKDEIVQIGAVRVVNGRIVEGEEINDLVDPGIPIPPASTKVHKVNNAMVAGKPGIAQAGRHLHSFAKGSVIVAHNAPFDMAFLHRHKGKMGVDWDNPILDTVLLSAVLFGASQTHTLDALCDRLGVTIPPALRHTALGDAIATAEVLVKMLPMCEARGLITFGDIIRETKRHGRLLEDLN